MICLVDYTFLPNILEQMSKDNRFPAILTQRVRVAAGLEVFRPHGIFTLEKDINPGELFVNKNSSRLWRAI